MTNREIKAWVEGAQMKLVAQLQDILAYETGLGFAFHLNGQTFWWIVELHTTFPCIMEMAEWPRQLKKVTKPTQLFLRSHVKNQRLKTVIYREELGRVIQLQFTAAKIEIVLIPHKTNIIVEANQKKMSWNKPQDLGEHSGTPPTKEFDKTIEQEWQEWRSGTVSKSQWDKARELTKRIKIVEELEKESHQFVNHWKLLADWISTHQTLQLDVDAPAEWTALLQNDLSLSQNIEWLYETGKKKQEKRAGLEQRIEVLKSEIARIQSGEILRAQKATKATKNSDSQYRRWDYDDKFIGFVGKSAEDNLLILREAQPWDLWLHLKDYPGAYGILRRPRQVSVPDSLLREFANWVAHQSKSSSRQLHDGDRVDVLVTEARFVKPLKGESKGLVTYQNERVLTFRYSAR